MPDATLWKCGVKFVNEAKNESHLPDASPFDAAEIDKLALHFGQILTPIIVGCIFVNFRNWNRKSHSTNFYLGNGGPR